MNWARLAPDPREVVTYTVAGVLTALIVRAIVNTL